MKQNPERLALYAKLEILERHYKPLCWKNIKSASVDQLHVLVDILQRRIGRRVV